MKSFQFFILLSLLITISCSAQIWLKEVKGYSTSSGGYAGKLGKPMTSLRVSGGEPYRVHILGGNWLPAVTGNNKADSNNGYAGIDGKTIDGVAIKGTTYRVHILGRDWLPEVSQYNINDANYGMAGIYGKAIDAIMIKGRTYASAYFDDSIQYTNSQKDVVRCVKAQLGKPYVYGAAGPDSFDCSGLAYYCHGNTIPRTALAQSQSGQFVSKSNLKAGDLMFWTTDGSGSVSHTTIYIGNGKMIHAPTTGKNVKEVYSSSSYWDPIYITARRYWK